MRTEIQIDWQPEVVERIQIQHKRIELAPQARFICVRPSRWRGHAAQSVLDTLDQIVLAAKLERRMT